MATINLGRVKPVFQGAYSNTTAYVLDDMVTDSGNTYICIAATTGNAPPNATYWHKMAQGSDLGGLSGLTAGDIAVYNGSAWVRQAIGTAGQALKVNSGATGLEYGTGANVGQVLFSSSSSSTSVSNGSNSYVDITGCSVTITPASTSSRFVVHTTVQCSASGNGGGYGQIRLVRGSTPIPFNPQNTHGFGNGSGDPYQYNSLVCVDSPATSSAITYKTQLSCYTSGTASTNSPGGSGANLMVMEILT